MTTAVAEVVLGTVMSGGDDKGICSGTGLCQLMKVQAWVTKDLPRAALFRKCERVFLPGLALCSVSGPSGRIIRRKEGSVQCVTWHLVRKDALHCGTGGEHVCPGTAYHAHRIISNLEVRFLMTVLSLLTRLSLRVPRDTTHVRDLRKYDVSYTPRTGGPPECSRFTQTSPQGPWYPGIFQSMWHPGSPWPGTFLPASQSYPNRGRTN